MKATDASVRTNKGVADLSTIAGMKVSTFETRHKVVLEIEAQLYYVKNVKQFCSLADLNTLNLNELNDYSKSHGRSEVLKSHPEWF
jgi:hypothetical protein